MTMNTQNRTQPWWVVDGDTKRSRRFDNYEAACAAGARAYHRHKAKGFDAEDKYHVVSGGDWYSVASFANKPEFTR
jgi:hypothetical protein